jgi:outer membrane protein insertion porin family
MSRRIIKTALALCACAVTFTASLAQSGTVESVEVQGLVRMTSEAFAHAFAIRAGDPYDPARIRAQYRALWDLGLFDDVTVEAEDGPGGGKVIIVKVKERASLASVTYQDNKVLTRTSIEDRLKEKRIALDVGKPLNLKSVADAESEIRMMLGEKGYLDPGVSHKLAEVTTNTVGVTYTIRPGAKTKIKKINFQGNEVYKSKVLLRQLELTEPYHWWKFWTQKSLYHPAKWDQDSGHIRDMYLNAGYLDIDLKPPVIELREKDKGKSDKPEKPAPPPPPPPAVPERPENFDDLSPKEQKAFEKKKKKAEKELEEYEAKAQGTGKRWVYLTVAVDEGAKYKLGTLSVTGNSVFTEQELLAQVIIKTGATAGNSFLDLGTKRMQRMYEDRGYAYATVRREVDRKTEERIADVRFIVNEDKPYTVDRIEFTGNTATQDKVLRREFRINEGDLFSRSTLDASVAKVNQLGYFEARPEAVSVQPIEGTNKVQITVPGEERGRNEIQVGGGYSGSDGAFFTGYYSTRNFLGRGQIVSLSLQLGGRRNLYQISFQEPWFLNRPYTLGFSLYRGDQDYGAQQRSRARGFGVVMGRQIGYFQQVQVRYDFQKVQSNGLAPQSGFINPVNPELVSVVAENIISKVTPSWYRNSINNPYRPSSGWSLLTDLEIAGGPFGGDTDYIRGRAIGTKYLRGFRRSFFAFHGEIGQISTWADGSTPSAANVNGIPRFQRFWLGGETYGPRVFQTRSVSPLRYVQLNAIGEVVEAVKDPTGRPVSDFDLNGDQVINRNDLVALGGNRYWLAMGEYAISFNQSPVELALFLDVGNTMYEDTSWGFEDYRAAAGLEVRFFLPVFPVPLRLIYGWPLRKLPEDRTSAFTFSIGRSF